MLAGTFETQVSVRLPEWEAPRLRRAINVALTGTPEVITLQEGEWVPTFPDKEPKLQEAHWNLNLTRELTFLVDVDEQGNWSNIRMKHDNHKEEQGGNSCR